MTSQVVSVCTIPGFKRCHVSDAQMMSSDDVVLAGAILTERACCSRSNRYSGCASRCSGQKILGM